MGGWGSSYCKTHYDLPHFLKLFCINLNIVWNFPPPANFYETFFAFNFWIFAWSNGTDQLLTFLINHSKNLKSVKNLFALHKVDSNRLRTEMMARTQNVIFCLICFDVLISMFLYFLFTVWFCIVGLYMLGSYLYWDTNKTWCKKTFYSINITR